MREIEIPATRVASGTVMAPPSKSVMHRVVLLTLVGGRELVAERPLVSDDTTRLLEAGRAAGLAPEPHPEGLRLVPGPSPNRPTTIDCGASGTLLRLMTGVLASRPGVWRLDGTPRLRQRPVAPLVEALRSLGAEISYLGGEGFAPLAIDGRALAGGSVVVDAGLSSQYVSALVLAALSAAGPVDIEISRLVSSPYVDLTLDYVRRFGGRVEAGGRHLRIAPGLTPPPRLEVEGDYSSAAYFGAAAALTVGEVTIRGLDAASSQGDRRFFDLLERMGALVEWAPDALVVRGRGLRAADIDMERTPDQVPTLAGLAPFAHGTTRIRGAAHLRLKESDRLAAMAQELRRLGAEVTELRDGLEIPGIWADEAAPTTPVLIDPHDDHRIAMSLAVLGLRRGGLRISQPGVVAKSYPAFWDDFESVLRG